jgi:hypothetical protein
VGNVSLSRRRDSAAIVSNTSDDFPEPETPVKTVILRRGMSTEMFLRLFSRAPRTWIMPKPSDPEERDRVLRNCIDVGVLPRSEPESTPAGFPRLLRTLASFPCLIELRGVVHLSRS